MLLLRKIAMDSRFRGNDDIWLGMDAFYRVRPAMTSGLSAGAARFL